MLLDFGGLRISIENQLSITRHTLIDLSPDEVCQEINR